MEEFMLYALSISTLVALLFAWHLFTRSRKTTTPPSPGKLPVIGNLHQLGQLPHRSLWSLSRRYGPLMLLHLGSKPMLVVSSADVAKQILKTHDLAFADRPAMKDLRKVFYDLKDVIHLPYGEQWRNLRSIVVHELLSSSRVKSFSSIREEEIALLIESIEECCSFDSSTPVNLTNMFAALSYDLIGRAAFGKKESKTENGKKILEALDETAALLFSFSIGEFVPWLAWIDRLRGLDAALDRIVEKRDFLLDSVIEDHLKSSDTYQEKENILDILLGIYKGDIPGVSIDLISIKGVILDVFAAGTETAATSLVWIMTELIRHPTVMKKLQDEIRGIMKGKQHISDDELQKMVYLKAVIKETFRLRPPLAFFFHVAREYVKLMGYQIAPKTMVFINVWAIGRDPACWDEPEKFMPERFMGSSLDFKGFDFQFIPFGAGRRICPGLAFATAAIEQTVANLMFKFDWALPNGARGEDLDVTERPGFTAGKKSPLLVVATVATSNSNA